MKKSLRVMKFGGTSVGDASCIARVTQIVKAAAAEGPIIAVVSAMSGVTNRLIDAANLSALAEGKQVDVIFASLRLQHETALASLIHDEGRRKRVAMCLAKIFDEGERLCKGTALLHELTPRSLDAISSLGERLSAPMVAGALSELGTPSESVEATELIVTDSSHGGADPRMDRTRERSEARLQPLLLEGVVPVVTGFIGATQDGVMTADPRLVPDARTILEISYREATELAYFGAKVLHPKTLHAVSQAGIPVWIRNSFTPERTGTKITPKGRTNGGGVKALTAIRDVALITVGGPGIVGLTDVVGRTFSTTAEVRASILLISQSSSQNDICFIVAAADAKRTVEALRKEFAQDVAHEKVEHITMDTTIAIVAVVGENMRGTPGVAGRTFNAVGRENVNIIAIAQGSSETNISFVVFEKEMKAALAATHREFGLAGSKARGM